MVLIVGGGALGLLLLALIVVAAVSGAPSNTAQSSGGSGGQAENGGDAKESGSARKGGADRADQQQISVGATAELEDHTLSVEEVERNYSPRDQFGRAKSGNEFMRVWATIENTSNRPVSFNPFYFEVQDSNGIQQGPALMAEVPYGFESGNLAPKGKVEGNLVFEVPKNDNNLKLIYESNMFNGETVTVEPLR